jgi:hypothetical protein
MTRHSPFVLAAAFFLAAPPVSAQPVGVAAPVAVQPDDQSEMQWAASVSQVNMLAHQGDASVSVFSTVGGDPAINGIYVFRSFYISPAEGYRIFKIGDVSQYRIVSETPGRLVLAVTEDGLGEGGEVSQSRRRVLVIWTPGAEGAPPASVTVRTAP